MDWTEGADSVATPAVRAAARGGAMTECAYHREKDHWGRSIGIRTLRCAHLGAQFIHERVCAETGRRWLNRQDDSRVVKPELISVHSDTDADRIWTEMERRMVEGAAFGEPY